MILENVHGKRKITTNQIINHVISYKIGDNVQLKPGLSMLQGFKRISNPLVS